MFQRLWYARRFPQKLLEYACKEKIDFLLSLSLVIAIDVADTVFRLAIIPKFGQEMFDGRASDKRLPDSWISWTEQG